MSDHCCCFAHTIRIKYWRDARNVLDELGVSGGFGRKGVSETIIDA